MNNSRKTESRETFPIEKQIRFLHIWVLFKNGSENLYCIGTEDIEVGDQHLQGHDRKPGANRGVDVEQVVTVCDRRWVLLEGAIFGVNPERVVAVEHFNADRVARAPN